MTKKSFVMLSLEKTLKNLHFLTEISVIFQKICTKFLYSSIPLWLLKKLKGWEGTGNKFQIRMANHTN